METTVVVRNESGLHARPAARFVKAANSFKSEIRILHKGKTVNAKSMVEMMLAAISQGETITIVTNGPDENEAMLALTAFVSGG
ncbi:MAG: HPr family phosphocarrier protein [Firmicutes bacterium]|nr:HPr family phosphocarrier protein [Bacillota bacterium]